MTETVAFEAFPIAGGALVGLLAAWLAPRRARYVLAAGLAALVGVAAFVLSGEFKISAEFLLFDLGQAVGAAVAMCALVQLGERRALRTRL